jgi:hypothetical protein
MQSDPRLEGLTVDYQIIAPTNELQYTVLELIVAGHTIQIPFDRLPNQLLIRYEPFLIEQFFMAVPTLILWVARAGIVGLSNFVHKSTPADALPASRSDWVMFSLISVDGIVPA